MPLLLSAFLPPPLPTLQLKPSWTNRAGRVDRSACLELRASELAPLITTNRWRSARTSPGRLAHATISVDSRLLFNLHNRRLPFTLIGDHRTQKSNAMKEVIAGGRPNSLGLNSNPKSLLPNPSFSNPNKGAARTKRLALLSGSEPPYTHQPWSQSLRLERWRLKSKRPRSTPSKSLPPDPTHHFLICPQCNTKRKSLFMVLAHEQEVNDAELAEGWIKLLESHPHYPRILLNNSALSTQHAALLSRYSLIFRNRQLLCTKCLGGGIRYGEVKTYRRDFDGPRAPAAALARGQARANLLGQREQEHQNQSDSYLNHLINLIPPRHRPPTKPGD